MSYTDVHDAETGRVEPSPPRLEKVFSFPNEDFDKQYMRDPFGEEASEHARVWKVYRDEARPRDEKKLEGWNKTFDVLLTFAGLYSAALTAFLVESYKTLQQDPSDYMAQVLFRVVALNPSANISVEDRETDAILPPDKGYAPTSAMAWVNGLWFTSLSLTLSVAFLCILAKQWLYEYESMLFDRTITARDWTRMHVVRSRGLKTWGVPFLVSALPTALHVALFLFMAGLFVFLREFHKTIANSIVVIGGSVLLFFLLQFVVPFWHHSCAWRTPFLRYIEEFGGKIRHTFISNTTAFISSMTCWTRPEPTLPHHAPTAATPTATTPTAATPTAAMPTASTRVRAPPKPSEMIEIGQKAPYLEAVALRRLLRSPTRNVVATAIQAIGSIRPSDPSLDFLRKLPGEAASDRVQGYIVSRSGDMASTSRSTDIGVMYESTHCIRAWATLTKFEQQLVQDKSLIHNQYHSDKNLPLDVQVINALLSDFTPLETGDVDFEFTDIALVFRRVPYESIQLHPSTVRLLLDIFDVNLGNSSSADGQSRRLLSELSVLHSLLCICILSSNGPDTALFPDLNRMTSHIAFRLERRGHFPMERDISAAEPPTTSEQRLLIPFITAWLRLAHFWSGNAPITYNQIDNSVSAGATEPNVKVLTYSATPPREHIAGCLLRLCRASPGSGVTRGLLKQELLFWDVLLCPKVESYAWKLDDVGDLLDVLHNSTTPRIAKHEKMLPALIRMAGRALNALDEESLAQSSLLLSYFRDPSFSRITELQVDRVDIKDFLDDTYGLSAWNALHVRICGDGKANDYVLRIASSLASALSNFLSENRDTGELYVKRFFCTNVLEHCVSGAYARCLSISRAHKEFSGSSADNESEQNALQWTDTPEKRELVDILIEFIRTCVKLSREETARVYGDLLVRLTPPVNDTPAIPRRSTDIPLEFLDYISYNAHLHECAAADEPVPVIEDEAGKSSRAFVDYLRPSAIPPAVPPGTATPQPVVASTSSEQLEGGAEKST